jgi:hypothetical protein
MRTSTMWRRPSSAPAPAAVQRARLDGARSFAVRARFVSTLLALLLVVVDVAIGQEAAQQKKQKKNPLARLAAPWPDAEKTGERRRAAENRRLFQGSDPLRFTLTADFRAVNKERDPASTRRFPAVLRIVGDDGEGRSIPVKLRTRGHFRLMSRNCSFVPLRVEFPRQEVEDTVFEGVGSLKLGTHCEGDQEYEQYTLREYLAYRIFNLLTPRSFRARLAKATHVDSMSGQTLATRYAMFIESEGDVARRLEGRVVQLPRTLFRNLDPETLTLMMLFEYMIGNTDFSIFALHNVRLVQDQSRILYPIPYDFDLSGVVNARYAIPDRQLRIKTVLERLYRGPCRTMEDLRPVLATFRAKKADVMAAVDAVPDLDKTSRRKAREYLEDFYRTIEHTGSVKSQIVETCAKSGM